MGDLVPLASFLSFCFQKVVPNIAPFGPLNLFGQASWVAGLRCFEHLVRNVAKAAYLNPDGFEYQCARSLSHHHPGSPICDSIPKHRSGRVQHTRILDVRESAVVVGKIGQTQKLARRGLGIFSGSKWILVPVKSIPAQPCGIVYKRPFQYEGIFLSSWTLGVIPAPAIVQTFQGTINCVPNINRGGPAFSDRGISGILPGH